VGNPPTAVNARTLHCTEGFHSVAHLHLATVIPAIPLVAILSSFGLTGMTVNFSPIHLLSTLVLITLPRAIRDARCGRMAGHRRTMTVLYASLVIAGLLLSCPAACSASGCSAKALQAKENRRRLLRAGFPR